MCVAGSQIAMHSVMLLPPPPVVRELPPELPARLRSTCFGSPACRASSAAAPVEGPSCVPAPNGDGWSEAAGLRVVGEAVLRFAGEDGSALPGEGTDVPLR